jgi:hypothetical protein
VELSEAEVDEQVIDSGLSVIRKLWDAGLAHRQVPTARRSPPPTRRILQGSSNRPARSASAVGARGSLDLPPRSLVV